MGPGASQIDVEIVREALSILGIGGATPKAFLHAKMDDQNSSLTTSDHVEFDDVLEVDASGDIALAVGAAQLGGLVTLAAGKTYLFLAGIRADFSGTGGVVRLPVRNNTAAATFGTNIEALPVSGGNSQAVAIGGGIITPAVETEVELRITGVFQLSSFRGAGAVGNTWLLVIEIG